MSLEPGVDDTMIKKDGSGRITRTQAPVRFDDLIGQLIYGSTNKAGNTNANAGTNTTAAPEPQPSPIKGEGA